MPRLACLILVSLLVALAPVAAQEPVSPRTDSTAELTVIVRRDTMAVVGVLVQSDAVRRYSDAGGRATLRLPAGERHITTSRVGFAPESLTVMLRAGVDTTVTIALTAQPVELSGVIVSATRSGRIADEPLRVEVLEQEEVEEKLLMTPGDITMMLNESSGLRVQTTSPSLGGASVRVQGMRGRYTQILADGLPLYGGQTGGLGLLQIPPMDLGGVEIIKGVASALYGGSALGGVINLISRRPEEERVLDFLLNGTTLGGADLIGFASSRLGERWGYTLLAGGHRQSQVDHDGDRWTDLPGYERVVVRPRAFWSSPAGHSVMLTAGTTREQRDGGTMDGGTVPTGEAFEEDLHTRRSDAAIIGGFLLPRDAILSIRGAIAAQRHRHTFGSVLERDRHRTALAEASVTIPEGPSVWVIGAAVQHEGYDAENVQSMDYDYTIPSMFAQGTMTLSSTLSATASIRVDRHSRYGMQVAPRLSGLMRVGREWTLRVSAGGGHFAPTPFTEETEVTGLTPLEPPTALREERGRSASIDLGGPLGPVEMNVTAFGSAVEDPVGLDVVPGSPGRVQLVNRDEATRTAGGELQLRLNAEPFHVSASYTYVRSTEQVSFSSPRRDVPLTPRQQAGIVTMWEQEDVGRAGVEVYYTGTQVLDDNPYRARSRPYVHLGVLAERRFGRARVFLNAENLLGFRQTSYDSLVLPARGLGGRWTTDAWGPLDGRVANVGVRLDAR